MATLSISGTMVETANQWTECPHDILSWYVEPFLKGCNVSLDEDDPSTMASVLGEGVIIGDELPAIKDSIYYDAYHVIRATNERMYMGIYDSIVSFPHTSMVTIIQKGPRFHRVASTRKVFRHVILEKKLGMSGIPYVTVNCYHADTPMDVSFYQHGEHSVMGGSRLDDTYVVQGSIKPFTFQSILSLAIVARNLTGSVYFETDPTIDMLTMVRAEVVDRKLDMQ